MGVMKHTFIHEDLADMLKSFRYDAHPMGMLATMFAAMGTQHPEANPALQGQAIYSNITLRNKQIHRILGSIPTMAAFAYRRRIGRPIVYPSHQKMTYSENFLYMLDMLSNKNYRPHPELAKALDVLFIIHADHELNCSTSAMRHLASSGVDVYTCVSAATGALYGPRHGGANEAVLRMLESIGGKDNIPKFLEKVKKPKPWRRRLYEILILRNESFIPMLIFTQGLYIRRWGSQQIFSRCCSRFLVQWVGFLIGMSSWTTRKIALSDLDRFTRDMKREITWILRTVRKPRTLI